SLTPAVFPYTTLFRSRDIVAFDPADHRSEDAGEMGATGPDAEEDEVVSAAVTLEDLVGDSPDDALAVVGVEHPGRRPGGGCPHRSEEHTSELQSRENL